MPRHVIFDSKEFQHFISFNIACLTPIGSFCWHYYLGILHCNSVSIGSSMLVLVRFSKEKSFNKMSVLDTPLLQTAWTCLNSVRFFSLPQLYSCSSVIRGVRCILCTLEVLCPYLLMRTGKWKKQHFETSIYKKLKYVLELNLFTMLNITLGSFLKHFSTPPAPPFIVRYVAYLSFKKTAFLESVMNDKKQYMFASKFFCF